MQALSPGAEERVRGKVLKLFKNNIGDDGAHAVAKMLTTSSCMTEVPGTPDAKGPRQRDLHCRPLSSPLGSGKPLRANTDVLSSLQLSVPT